MCVCVCVCVCVSVCVFFITYKAYLQSECFVKEIRQSNDIFLTPNTMS